MEEQIDVKANLGCGPIPLYPQDLEVMGSMDGWLLVDKFIQDPRIKNWDVEVLDEIPDGHLEFIYTSHTLEHISHKRVNNVLKLWNRKLKPGGKIVINVPDLVYACRNLLKWEQGQIINDHYNDFDGPLGLINIFYGSHSQDGEYHMSGYTKKSLETKLMMAGFVKIDIQQIYDAHKMGVLIATAWKK